MKCLLLQLLAALALPTTLNAETFFLLISECHLGDSMLNIDMEDLYLQKLVKDCW